jgi:gamma-glutamyltranspeptidase/glutathione hydrolase
MISFANDVGLVLCLGLAAAPLFWGDGTGAAAAPATGTKGMVSSAHPRATEAGLEILRRGGNAFDAAVAVAAALNVVEPAMSGMGGYGTILVYDAVKKNVLFLNSSGRIPAAVNSDAFRAPTANFQENRRGAKAVSTPGNVHAWEEMSRRFGRMAWKDLFGPALRLAGEGFVLGEGWGVGSAFGEFPAEARAIFGREGRPLGAGERLVQKDLARSLGAVAEGGAKAFYEGEIGRAIDAEMRRAGGFLSLSDLRDDKAEWGDPIRIAYRGTDVYTASPPATSFCSLVRLGIMSRFDVAALGLNTAETLHRFIEASKHAFWCRLRYAGDPGVSPPPLDLLFSPEYWREQAGLVDPLKAKPFAYPALEKSESRHTTHFVVADAAGNIVCATQTLGNAFGSRIMPPGTGIWLNNSLAYCTFEPKGNPMDAHAGRRKLSGDCPTILVRDGRPWAALGTPGGHNIGQTVPQMVMNLVDFKMDIAAALAAPRVSFIEPDVIAVESGVAPAVREKLSALGHNLRVVGGLSNAHGLTIAYGPDGKPAGFAGAADPRGRGLARGY